MLSRGVGWNVKCVCFVLMYMTITETCMLLCVAARKWTMTEDVQTDAVMIGNARYVDAD